jgi:regulator of sirC expression with transglutaminase-like and TPR domain
LIIDLDSAFFREKGGSHRTCKRGDSILKDLSSKNLLELCSIVCAAFAFTLSAAHSTAMARILPAERVGVVRQVKVVLELPEATIDLAKAKLTFDKIVDPSVDIEANLREIDRMVHAVRAMAGPSASARDTITALRAFLYESGDWNHHKPFQYDLSDPLGTHLPSRLLSNYLRTRLGNCVSMPILFVILADRLGLHATLALAPQHLLVKYTDDLTGRTFNVEATSGGHVARDEWYRKNLPMSDAAIANGLYLRPLSRIENVAVMAQEILEFDMAEKRYQEIEDVADAILAAYPNFVDAMLFQATASGRLIDAEFRSRYPNPNDIPSELRPRFLALLANDKRNFERAETLGWREAGEPAQAPNLSK